MTAHAADRHERNAFQVPRRLERLVHTPLHRLARNAERPHGAAEDDDHMGWTLRWLRHGHDR